MGICKYMYMFVNTRIENNFIMVRFILVLSCRGRLIMMHIIRQPIQPDQFYRDHPCTSLTGTTHQIAIDDTF